MSGRAGDQVSTPATTPATESRLGPDELITAIEVPARIRASHGLKVREWAPMSSRWSRWPSPATGDVITGAWLERTGVAGRRGASATPGNRMGRRAAGNRSR